MKIYAADSEDKSLAVFQDIAGGNIWVKVKDLDYKLTTFIKIYSVESDDQGTPCITYSRLPFFAHEYLYYEETDLYDTDYDVFQRAMRKQKTVPAHWFEVITPVELFTEDEINEILSSYTLLHED